MNESNEEKYLTLSKFLKSCDVNSEIEKIILSLVESGKKIQKEISLGDLSEYIGFTGNKNIQDEEVTKLDIFANNIIINQLKETDEVRYVASEEDEFVNLINRNGNYVVNMDPLDGFSNVEIDAGLGTIFGILKYKEELGENSSLQSGNNYLYSGYILYGSSVVFALADGNSVNLFTLDPRDNEFKLTSSDVQIPNNKTKPFMINFGNYKKWNEVDQDVFMSLIKEQNISGRNYGCMVADIHNILKKGGIYAYPADFKNEKGKIRMLYEIGPLGHLVKSAGGITTDGFRDLLEIIPKELHQRAPIFIGEEKIVKEVINLYSNFSKEEKKEKEKLILKSN